VIYKECQRFCGPRLAVLQIILQLHGLPCKLNVWWDGLNLMNFHHLYNTIPSFKTIVVFGNNYSMARQPKDTLAILYDNLLSGLVDSASGRFLNTPV
jgi:hypothetical protein